MPMRECPSFDYCSAPRCPLDPDIDDRISLKGEDKCKAQKPTRMKIAEKYPNLLPYKGLFKKQYVGKMLWERKSSQEREKITQALANSRKTII
jgi:hypothetical protein